MTAPITIEEYKENQRKVDAAIEYLVNELWRVDIGGNNPTIGQVQAQAKALRQVLSTAPPQVLVDEANKLIALVDKALVGPSLDTNQKSTLTSTIASVAHSREVSKNSASVVAQPPAQGLKKTPDAISSEVWEANQRAVVSTAKEVIASLRGSTDPDIKKYVGEIETALVKGDNVSLYIAMGRLQAVVGISDSTKAKLDSVSKAMAENQRSSNGKTMEAPPKAAEAPPKPQPAAGKLCEPITHERWGVRFRFLDKPPEKKGECETKDKDTWDLKDWFLQLLPAMQSVIPRQGARDVPNAGPGLSFKFKNNMVKHKIPGGQPVYQMMGVDSAIITFVGTFTGDGGLGYINKVDIENGEIAEKSLKMLEAEGAARRAGQAFDSAQKYGGTYPYGKGPVNAMFNPIYHVRNRALAPGGDTSSALVGSNSTGWLMDNSILRQGFFERDGCPGQCPPPSWGGFPNGHMDEAGGKFAWGDFGVWPDGTPYGNVGTRSQMDTHKLAHIAAYLDAYHEMVSFYKFAVQAGKLMEITINLRKTHDGLKPRVADPRMKGKLRSDTPDPLRDMHTGNPTFKGYLRTMSTWAQYSDRVWYVMEFEVVDHGLQGKKAVNLTNRVQAGGAGSETPDSGGGETPDSGGSDNSQAGVSGTNSGGTTPAAQQLDNTLSDAKTLKTKDGEVLTLQGDGFIVSEDGKRYLSYDEAYDKLHFYDLPGRTTLYNWFNENRVVPYGKSIVIRNNDGTGLMLGEDGSVKQYSKYNPNEKPVVTDAPPAIVDSISRENLGGLNAAQRAALNEWMDRLQAPPVPTTSPAPTPPPSTTQPLEKLGPLLPSVTLEEPIVIPRNTSPPIPPAGIR